MSCKRCRWPVSLWDRHLFSGLCLPCHRLARLLPGLDARDATRRSVYVHVSSWVSKGVPVAKVESQLRALGFEQAEASEIIADLADRAPAGFDRSGDRTYDLSCECGETISVTEASAGMTLPCRCGRGVRVPRLRELRVEAGVGGTPVELLLNAELLGGRLHEDRHCVGCQRETDKVVNCITTCELMRAGDSEGDGVEPLVATALFGVLIGLVLMLRGSRRGEWGRDHLFHLPLRLCDECQAKVTDDEKLKEAMRRVPIYGRLLNKYPRASVSV